MGRTITKPKLKVNSFFLNEMSAEQAFADYFYLAMKESAKSSVDTIGKSELTDYNAENDERRSLNNVN